MAAISDTYQRLLEVLQYLAANPKPMRLKDVADAFQVSPPLALRDLENLAHAGFAARRHDGLWEAGEKMKQLGRALARRELNQLLERLQ